MMKLVYAVDKISYNDKDHVGVVKKVESQMKLFNKNGIETSLCQYEWQGGYPQIQIEKDTDILYFRRIEPSVKMLCSLRRLKKKNSKLRLIMEIPTYPFGAEERKKIPLKVKMNRWLGEIFLHTYVDRIVLIAQKHPPKKLYRIPVICVNNGVDFEDISVRRINPLQEKDTGIHMVCVSGCFFWHGYDRIIEGLHRYYENNVQKRKVYFHIVGEGDCLQEYKNMADKYGMTNKEVFFHGRRIGSELDEIYNLCDVALDCFGAHRKSLKMSSSLKTREYAAKGLPMATSVELDICNDKTKDYIMMLPSGEEPIDIEGIVKFYNKVYNKDKSIIAQEIRNCFFPYCDWQFVFKEVIDYIK